jgi:hypothetical protein
MDSFENLYEKYLKDVIDPSRAYSFEEFSKIDNLKKQYLADPKNFRFDLPYSAGRRTFPATEKVPIAQVSPNVGKVPIAEKITRVLSEEEKRNVKKLLPSDVRKAAPYELSVMDKPGFKIAEDFVDPNKFYRVFSGNQAYEDILESGKIRTIGSPTYKGTNPHLNDHPSLSERIKVRPTAWPSFKKGKANLSYAQGLPDHYIIETEEKLMTPSRGRHSPGSTYFPIDEKGLAVDETKTKIYKHLGEGKYEQVRSTNKGFGTAAKEMAQGSRSAINILGKAIGPAFALAEGGIAAQDVINKMKAGESLKEATSNPEVVKNAARGVLGYMGGTAGTAAGVAASSMLPGGLPVKIATEVAGAVGGGYLGTKLADLLTGNPVLDKIIRDRYEKARNERMAQTKPTAASSVALKPGE